MARGDHIVAPSFAMTSLTSTLKSVRRVESICRSVVCGRGLGGLQRPQPAGLPPIKRRLNLHRIELSFRDVMVAESGTTDTSSLPKQRWLAAWIRCNSSNREYL
jgi:hypothetical protein